jgi:hypothetical protein
VAHDDHDAEERNLMMKNDFSKSIIMIPERTGKFVPLLVDGFHLV